MQSLQCFFHCLFRLDFIALTCTEGYKHGKISINDNIFLFIIYLLSFYGIIILNQKDNARTVKP